VQQAVGLTVRLYYSGPISGQLDQPDPDGATMQRVGEDTQYARQIGSRAYSVLERHFLLIPERSGTLTIPGAHFKGTGTPGFFDDLLGNGGRPLVANSAPRFLHVLEAPADAPQPWLPLRALTLRYLETPQRGRAGESITVTVEATADGATAAQMPPLQLVAGDGAQVFAEPAQSDESFADGRPKVRTVRRFSIVPSQAGTLHITGPSQAWWDVRARLRRTASLPDLSVPVSVGVDGSGAPTAPGASASARDGRDAHPGLHMPGLQGIVQPWALAAVVFAAAWLLTLMWALQRRQPSLASKMPEQSAIAGQAPAQASLRDFKRALDHEDLGRVAEVLCALCSPPAATLDGVRLALDDARQIAAVDALQRARWGDGDGVKARASLRDAFRRGPRWKRTSEPVVEAPLPPLYPGD
jgi:hypothetical protein